MFISLLSICLLVLAPSLVQAEELEQSAVPIDTTTEDISASNSLQQDSSEQSEVSSDLSQLSSALTTDVQGILQGDGDFTVSSSLQVSNESINSDTNAQVSEQPTVQASETKIIADDQGTVNTPQTSEISGEQTVSAENSNVSVSAELPAVKQNTVINPLLSVNLLGISVDVLGENKQGNSLVDRSLLSINANSLANEDLSSTQPLGTSGGLLGIDLGLPTIGNVNLDLLSGATAKSATGETLLTQGGLLGLGITDSALLGDVNLGVLTGNLQDENNLSGGLATIDIDNLLGQTHIGLIEGNKSTIGDITTIQGGLLLTDLNSTLLGDTHLGVLEVNSIETPEYKELHTGLILGDIQNSLLGDNHLGILENQQKETDEGKISSGGLVIIDSKDSPLGNTHIGVGEIETIANKEPISKPTDSNPVDSTTSTISEPSEMEEEKYKQDSNPSFPIGEDLDVTIKPIEKGTQIEELETVDEVHVTDEQENKDSVADFIKELTDAGNKIVLNQQTEKDSDELKQIIDMANEKRNHSESMLPSSGASFSGSSSGTGSAGASGSSVSNAGSGVAAYLNAEYIKEVALNNQAQFIVNKLSDQWQLAPPVEPPKSFFFLHA